MILAVHAAIGSAHCGSVFQAIGYRDIGTPVSISVVYLARVDKLLLQGDGFVHRSSSRKPQGCVSSDVRDQIGGDFDRSDIGSFGSSGAVTAQIKDRETEKDRCDNCVNAEFLQRAPVEYMGDSVCDGAADQVVYRGEYDKQNQIADPERIIDMCARGQDNHHEACGRHRTDEGQKNADNVRNQREDAGALLTLKLHLPVDETRDDQYRGRRRQI